MNAFDNSNKIDGVKCESISDDWNREIYSVDASNYVIKPSLIFQPRDDDEILQIMTYAKKNGISITCKGAGTGLVGQSLGSGIIIDFARKMDKILEISDEYVIVQPGVVKSVLDIELRKRGKFLPPDPSSSNYCTLGGMIANNASGPHGLGYGSIIDYIDAVNIIYADGTNDTVQENQKYDLRVLKALRLVSSNLNYIRKSYPNVSKNSCGYRVDSIIDEDGKFRPQRLFAASEGTLGIVTSAKLRIIDIPPTKYFLILEFNNIQNAAKCVPRILKYSPAVLELLDPYIGKERNNMEPKSKTRPCTLYVEFDGVNKATLYNKVSIFESEFSSISKIVDSGEDESGMKKASFDRRNALNSIMKLAFGSRKPVGIIEDTVVPPVLLHYYLEYLLELYNKYDISFVIYGHAGNGNLHTRPFIDFESKRDKKILEILTEEVFRFIVLHGGSISGEHGDGLARTEYVPLVYGYKIFSIFKEIKRIFDPTNLLNPNKKIIL